MTQDNSNSTMEMGTSDQELIAAKKKKRRNMIIGGVLLLIIIAVTIALIVVFTVGDGEPDSEAEIGTTEGPTPPTTVTTTTVSPPDPDFTTTTTTVSPPDPDFTTTTTTVSPPDPDYTTTTATVSPPDPDYTTTTETATTITPEPEPDHVVIDLDAIINGAFAAPSFNGSWISGEEVLYRNQYDELVLYNVDSGDVFTLVPNSSDILQGASRVADLSPDRSHVVLAHTVVPVYRHSFLAHYSAVNVESGTVIDIGPVGVSQDDAYLQNFVWGPSGTSCAFVYSNNVYYKANLNADAIQLTDTGRSNVIYNGIPDWVYEEEVFSSNIALWFSPDGAKMAYATFDDEAVRVMRVPHYGVPGSIVYQYTQHNDIRYPKSGTTNPTVSVTLREVNTLVQNVYTPPQELDQPILLSVAFVSNESLAVVWTNRVQNNMIVVMCSNGETQCTPIYSRNEQDGWIDNNPLIFNSEGNAFITILPQAIESRRYKQVVQVTNSGEGLWTLTGRSNTPHTVAEILRWEDDDTIWYKATHVNDSAAQHLYKIEGTNASECFTCGISTKYSQCLYNDGVISSDGSRIVVTCAGPGIPQVLIYHRNGSLTRSWDENTAVSELVDGRALPLTLHHSVPVAEGLPDAAVHIQVPHDYQTRNNVPLLVYVYGGPDSALVTHQWSVDWGTSLVTRWGIAVAHIDGRGAGLRGVDNLFTLNRRLGTVEIEDQISVTRYLQQNEPWLDSNRTCIWGWSYGGYASSLALARGGDVFRCAIAVAPVTDWHFYDTIYTERYMDIPTNNIEGYANSSLLTNEVVEAFRNKRYFLVHGTADDNVHYQHAMLLSRRLQTQDVYFTQMSYTDEQHGLLGVRPHLYHSLEKFLSENML